MKSLYKESKKSFNGPDEALILNVKLVDPPQQ